MTMSIQSTLKFISDFFSGVGQAVGPTIDSCGPFGCLAPSNTSSIGAGGLGGSLTQTSGSGTGPLNQLGATGQGLRPFGSQTSGQNIQLPFSTANGNHGSAMGGGASAGPFATINGNSSAASGPFSSVGGGWQAGSANGKGWATGGITGPFSNGQGSGSSSGPFHNNGGNNGGNGSGSGSNGGAPSFGGGATSNNSSGPYGGAPGTAAGGPFQMHTGTGNGLPYSPFSVAAGNHSGSGASSGPFAGAGGGSGGPFAGAAGGANSGPFSQASGGSGVSNGPFGSQTGTSHMTDGSGGLLEPSIGSYSNMQHGSSFTWGSTGYQNGGQYGGQNGGHGPFSVGQQPSTGNSGNGSPFSGNTQTNTGGSKLLEQLKDCPDTLACMKACKNGYQLQGSFENGCPTCICSDTGTVGGTLIQEKARTGKLPFEPPHGKTNNLHRRKQRRRSASR